MLADPASLDPHKVLGDSVVLDLFEGLTTMSASNAIVPGMATSWEASADGLIWTFHLRDAVWSDGTAITAEDFVYSFRRALDPATACPYIVLLAPILYAEEISSGREKDLPKLGVLALDPHTLRFTLTQPTPWFPALMANHSAMPVPRQAIEKWGDKWTSAANMVTNGPFILKKWVPLGEVDLARNPLFHDAASVKIDEVDNMLADDSGTALKRYEAGELDVVRVLGKDLPRLKQERPAELHADPLLATVYITINMKSPLGNDARVRQALAMVIDREVLEKEIIRRGQIPAYGFVPPGMPDYAPQRPDWAELPMAARIAKAKMLLAEAGASTPLKVHMLTLDVDFAKLYTSAIVEMWHSALGVEVEVETGEARVLAGRFTHHDFEITISNWAADYLDPESFLGNLRSNAAGLNYGSYANPKYDALLDQARSAADPATRVQLLQAAEALMLADQPIIPVDYTVTQTLVSPRLQGYEAAPLARHPDRFLSIDKRRE
jgi:oligopeptide transport system substrate-binding protein